MKTIESVQKIIKIGSSAGVTIPARDLKFAKIEVGDEVEIIVRKPTNIDSTQNDETIQAAKDILHKYKTDFNNLSQR